MRITDLLDARSILLNASPKSKNEALDQIVDLMVKSEKINDKEAYRKQVYAREEESTTGIGEGIAIPHGKCDAVTKPGLAAMVVKDGVDFDSLDGEPVTLMFLIAAPNTEDNVHLEVLSRLSMLLMDEDFRNKLLHAKDVDEFLAYVDAAEKEKFPEEAEEKAEAVIQAWYPLGHGDKALLQEPLFAQLGKKYGKSAPQIILRWHIQSGNIVIPGSKNPDHIKSNFDLFDFALTDDEMAQITALNKNVRYYTSTPEMLKKYAEMVPPVDEQK